MIYLRKKTSKDYTVVDFLNIFYLLDYFLLLMRKKSIHPYVRAHVVALHDAGLNQVQISKHLKVSRCIVQNAIKKCKQQGRFDVLKHTGCLKSFLFLRFPIYKDWSKGILALMRAKL